jgi:uncharacterized protein (DUF2235 family)
MVVGLLTIFALLELCVTTLPDVLQTFARSMSTKSLKLYLHHAMSTNERRGFFRQNLWAHESVRTDIKQVWCSGVLSDIGGENAAGGGQLALGAFRWMVGEAIAAGLY